MATAIVLNLALPLANRALNHLHGDAVGGMRSTLRSNDGPLHVVEQFTEKVERLLAQIHFTLTLALKDATNPSRWLHR